MPERSPQDTLEFLQLARDRFKLSAEAESATRAAALDDLEFSVGEQWPTDIRADRQISGRPCLTINVLPQFIKQVTNEQRQNRPSINVNPVGDGADVDTAEILQGVTRHIEVNCDAEVSYDYSFDYMVRTGFGYMRLDTKYSGRGKKDQEIIVRLIRNPFSVYLDPNAQELDRSDAKWGFHVDDIPVREFKNLYSKSAIGTGQSDFAAYQSIGDATAPWASTAGPLPTIRVAEYWYLEGDDPEFRWAKITALDILDEEKTIWECVPLIGTYGDDLNVNGKIHQSGLVRFAKDPQRQKNYWASAATEMIALAPKAPFIGALGQFKTKKSQWEQANVRNFSYLEYDPVAVGGAQAPPPQRNAVEPPIQAMNQMLQQATIDLQATARLNDANLGQSKRPDESGKAVIARQKQGSIATLDYSDNQVRAIRHLGRQILKAIPKVYPAPKIQRIIKPDGSVSHVGIYNSQNDDKQAAHTAIAALDPNIKKIYDIGLGTYDVTVSVGPSYQTKRQEAVETQMALIQADPQLIGIMGDILVGNMDIPGAQEIAKRLKKLLPPQLQDNENQTPEAQLAQAQSQLQALGQQHQQLMGALQEATQKINSKQIEMDSRMQIEQFKAHTDLMLAKAKIDAQVAIAEINTKAQNAMERARMYNEVWTELHGSAHELGMQQDQQAHQQQLAQQQAQQAQQSQQSDQQHDVGMAAMNQQQEQQPQNGNGQ